MMRLRALPVGGYLQRSARLMRETITPALAGHHNSIDKHVVLLLSQTRPMYVNKAAVLTDGAVRRVGHIFLRESLLCHGRMRPVRGKLLG